MMTEKFKKTPGYDEFLEPYDFRDDNCRELARIMKHLGLAFYTSGIYASGNGMFSYVFVGHIDICMGERCILVGVAENPAGGDTVAMCENVLARIFSSRAMTSEDTRWMRKTGLPVFSSISELKMKLELTGYHT